MRTDQDDFSVSATPWYVARCLEVEVASQGHSVEEALVNLKEALELYFEDAPPVEASHPIVAPVEIRIPA